MARTSLKIETWYDIRCDKCGLYRSTDFGWGSGTDKKALRKYAKSEGWRCVSGETLCPNCVKEKNMSIPIEYDGFTLANPFETR